MSLSTQRSIRPVDGQMDLWVGIWELPRIAKDVTREPVRSISYPSIDCSTFQVTGQLAKYL